MNLKQNKSILLSAGHSNLDPGAISKDGRKEADVAVEFRNMVSFYLLREQIEHELDGKETTNLQLKQAAAIAKRCDVSLEFHCNASDNVKATGVETLSGPNSTLFSVQLCRAISETLDIRNRGAKLENSGQHSRLAFVRAGGVIVELFFISNPDDLAAYDAKKWLAAKAVADVLIKLIGE